MSIFHIEGPHAEICSSQCLLRLDFEDFPAAVYLKVFRFNLVELFGCRGHCFGNSLALVLDFTQLLNLGIQ